MLKRMEKVSKLLFTTSSFDDSNVRLQVKLVTFLGNKGQDDKRLSPVYTKEYESEKYSNRNTLQSMDIITSDFIVFSYNDFDNKISEDCYISYPHLEVFRNFISDIYDMVINSETCVFTDKNKIKKGMDEESVFPEKNFSNDSTMWAIPTVIQRTEDSPNERGIYFFLNSDDNYIEISEAGIRSLYEIFVLSNLNLLSMSFNLLLSAMLFDSEGKDSSDSDTSSPAGRNRNPRQRPGRNSGSSPAGRRPTKKVVEEDEEEEDTSEEYEEDNSEEETTPKRKGSKKSSSNKVSHKPTKKNTGKSGKKTSFDRILEEAKEIEMDDEEEIEMDDEE